MPFFCKISLFSLPFIGDNSRSKYMDNVQIARCLNNVCAVAEEAGAFIRANWLHPKTVNELKQHDIKLKLDVETQQLITQRLLALYPDIALFGEEGCTGNPSATYRWVVDPIDGTVNFAFDIPHACVSIALQQKQSSGYQTILGVVFDPFCHELWTATRDEPAKLNRIPIHVSNRSSLGETVISIGFGKLQHNVNITMDAMAQLTSQVRKIRMMGSAALDLVYVASGRLDAYIEAGVRLWDIAAGGFIIERAGGQFHHSLIPDAEPETYKIVATNGHLCKELHPYLDHSFD